MNKPKRNQLYPDVLATKKKKEALLKNSKTFCMMPWTHMYINPNGDVLPCCIGKWNNALGNTNMQTIKEIWSDVPYQNLRKNMINGVKSKVCEDCYLHEKGGGSSMREWANFYFGKYIDALDSMNPDGSMQDLNWKYFDVRFSNTCNFKCRTCNDHFSTQWAFEDEKFSSWEGNPKKTQILNASNASFPLMPQFKHMLPQMEIINFAGGEPLITPEHYEILEYLIEQNATQMQLKYSSNLSVLKYKSKNIIELWEKFPNILLMASLDHCGEKAEYIRSGTDWKNQVNNLKKIKEALPHIKLTFNSVISIFNAASITDFLDEMIDLEIFDPAIDSELSPTLYRLTGPAALSIKVYDAETKKEIEEKLLAWLDKHPQSGESIKINIKGIIEYMKEDHSHLMPRAKEEIDRIDYRRKESFVKTFPELERFYNLCKEAKDKENGNQ